MAVDITLAPLATYPSGARAYGPAALPDSATRLTFKIARCTTATPTIWPSSAVTVLLVVEIFANGVWEEHLRLNAAGGIVSKFGVEAQYTAGGFDLPADTNRQIRGSVTIAGGSLRSTLIATVE